MKKGSLLSWSFLSFHVQRQGEGYYNKAQTLCDQEARRSNDVPLHLWKAGDQNV